MFVTELLLADASCGGKARGLAQLLRAGSLAVPDGFVVTNDVFRAAVDDIAVDAPDAIGHALADAEQRIAAYRAPDALARDVEQRAAALGPLVAVRSSATIEDSAAGAAAGVYSSRRAVPAGDVWEAIRAVWRSALTPLAAAYARRRGGDIAVAVIVQRFVEGERLTVYTRPPGKPDADEILVQQGERVIRLARPASEAELIAPGVAPGVIVAARHALRAEQIIGAHHGADVELVQESSRNAERAMIQTWTVQARPIVHPRVEPLVAPPPVVLAPLRDGRTWTWDAAHNPDPLSVAQAELAERVEEAGASPGYALRVCAGYLYAAERETPQPEISSEQELAMRAAELEARMEAALVATSPAWPAVLDGYVAFYRIWAGEMAPLIRAARKLAGREATPGERPSAVEATLLAAARGEIGEQDVERALGCLSPAWDVAVPTFAERPGLIRDAIDRARGFAAQAPAARTEATGMSAIAADLAERDDLYFARAQWLVRQALLALGRDRGLAADDVFWIPFAELPAIDPVTATRKAAGARAAAARAAKWRMPITVPEPGEATGGSGELRGVGTGPRATGRVVRFASLASAIAVGHGDVVVTRAMTPALAVLVAGCAAIVSETGGLLDHGAALARELGIPCVVGASDAWSRLSDGMVVTVDGAAGTVEVIG